MAQDPLDVEHERLPENERSRPLPIRPSLLYCNTGAWHVPSGQPSLPELVSSLRSFGERHVLPAAQGGRRVWGTVLGHRVDGSAANKLYAEAIREAAEATARALPPGWLLLRRDTPFSRLGGKAGYRGLRLSYHHQPHIVNWVDLQRLLLALRHNEGAAPSLKARWSSSACRPAGGAVVSAGAANRPRVEFTPECTGLGAARHDKHFLEAYQHVCRVNVPDGP